MNLAPRIQPWHLTVFTLIFTGTLLFVIVKVRDWQTYKRTLELEMDVAKVSSDVKVQADNFQKLDKMKANFFADISHEFRTPLTLILGPLEELIANSTESQSRRQLKTIQQNAKRLLRLNNQLLDLSRLENIKTQLQAGPGDFVSFLKGLVMSFESLAEEKNIDLRFQMNHAPHTRESSEGSSRLASSPVSGESTEGYQAMYFDTDKVEKIFSNLISNAFKFTPKGGTVKVSGTVIVDCRSDNSTLGPGQKVEVRIEDTGNGIPEDRLLNIFDRFYRVETFRTPTYKGIGIGLALVKEMHTMAASR